MGRNSLRRHVLCKRRTFDDQSPSGKFPKPLLQDNSSKNNCVSDASDPFCDLWLQIVSEGRPLTTANPARGQPAPVEIEYRGSTRFRLIRPCHIRRECADDRWRGIMCSLSASGAGVVLPMRLDPNTLVSIESALPGQAPSLVAKVVHSTRFQYLWLAGCEFTDGQLSAADLRRWLECHAGG